jgi:hypothetical protein
VVWRTERFWLSRLRNRILIIEDSDFGEWVFAHR